MVVAGSYMTAFSKLQGIPTRWQHRLKPGLYHSHIEKAVAELYWIVSCILSECPGYWQDCLKLGFQ